MKMCVICREPILKGQKIAVTSFPLECLDRNGGYSFVSEFIENEEVTHYKCFKKISQQLIDIIIPEKDNQIEEIKDSFTSEPDYTINIVRKGLNQEIKEVLSELGEKVSVQEVQNFLIQHPDIKSMQDAIPVWLALRKSI